MRKSLPHGTWISFSLLAPETTDQDLQAFLAQSYIDVPLERISVDADRNGRNAFAVISLEKIDFCNLLQRALFDENGNDRKLHGRAVVPRVPQNGKS